MSSRLHSWDTETPCTRADWRGHLTLPSSHPPSRQLAWTSLRKAPKQLLHLVPAACLPTLRPLQLGPFSPAALASQVLHSHQAHRLLQDTLSARSELSVHSGQELLQRHQLPAHNSGCSHQWLSSKTLADRHRSLQDDCESAKSSTPLRSQLSSINHLGERQEWRGLQPQLRLISGPTFRAHNSEEPPPTGPPW